MATEFQLRQSQWFYDDAGYYSYVLFNAPQDQVKSIQQVLKNNGYECYLPVGVTARQVMAFNTSGIYGCQTKAEDILHEKE